MTMMAKTPWILFLTLFAGTQSTAFAEDPIQLDRTTVIDNHELPKITYIVPWQAAQLPQLEKPPLDTLINGALSPIDRDVLRSRIKYYYEITPAPQAPAQTDGETSR